MGTSSSTLTQRINAAAASTSSRSSSGDSSGGCKGCSIDSASAPVMPTSLAAVSTGTLPAPPVSASVLFAAALAEANVKRALHGSPPLALALGAPEQAAMQNAATIAAAFQKSGCSTLAHTANTGSGTDTPKVGQNIYAVTLGGNSYTPTSFGDLLAAGVNMWYEEINGSAQSPGPYFDSTGKPFTSTFDSARGHFTQLVWKSSTRVAFGVATATCSGTPWLIFVANFTPPGNVISPATMYADNVLPPTSNA